VTQETCPASKDKVWAALNIFASFGEVVGSAAVA
jgi:hypothetical protein